MRTAYLGTSGFAAEVLRALARSAHAPALVVTPPDRRRGRGRRPAPPPAAQAALDLGLDLHQSADVNRPETLRSIRAAQPEALAVCAFGQLIREPLLSQWTALNVHPSLLPRWRGAAPIERAIMAGDERTGVSIMRVSEGLDSGPVAIAVQTPIGAEEDFGHLSERLAALGGELLVAALDRLAAGELDFAEQDESEATYAEKIDPAERRLHPARPAAELSRTVRALNPHLGAYLAIEGGDRLGVGAATAVPGGPAEGVLASAEGELLLGCAGGALRLDTVHPPGGRPMAASEFLRGHPIPGRAS